jgi:hypothetical protein
MAHSGRTWPGETTYYVTDVTAIFLAVCSALAAYAELINGILMAAGWESDTLPIAVLLKHRSVGSNLYKCFIPNHSSKSYPVTGLKN